MRERTEREPAERLERVLVVGGAGWGCTVAERRDRARLPQVNDTF